MSLGAIGTLGESWSYMLQDGAGSTRQLVDEEGAVNLSVSYTPWGDTMEIYGSGMLNLGYMGGVYDAGTGLIYMGNGQYYDPGTGRFLTRGAQQDQSNPYTPFNRDPSMMLISPLLLLGMVFGRKKEKSRIDNLLIIIVIIIAISSTFFMIGEAFIPTVMADVDRPAIGTPSNPAELEGYTALPSYTQASIYRPVITIVPNHCVTVKRTIEDIENEKWDTFWDLFEFNEMPEKKKFSVMAAVLDVAAAFSRTVGGPGMEVFVQVFDLSPSNKMIFEVGCPGCGGGMGQTISSTKIQFNENFLYYSETYRTENMAMELNIHMVVHELGHAFANTFWYKDDEGNDVLAIGSPNQKSYPGTDNSWWLTDAGFDMTYPHQYLLWRQHPREWDDNADWHREAIADSFMNWVYEGKGFTDDKYGKLRKEYMDTWMPIWIRQRLTATHYSYFGRYY